LEKRAGAAHEGLLTIYIIQFSCVIFYFKKFIFQKKYVEEQRRIETSLKLDFEKVKEEEIQRREQVIALT
jgi:hypothetical protein